MTRASFDALVMRLAETPTTFTERELLEPSHWSLGEDARLREDLRFRETPWGRWMLAENFIANDAIHRWLHTEQRSVTPLDAALERASEQVGRRCVFCVDDPRFVLRDGEVHLAASELTRQPVVEDDIGEVEKYNTHLPLHTLKAAAASEPAGEWGDRAQEEVIETLGWVRVSLPGRRLNERMFIAAIEGHSMDDGRSGLVDTGYAVFELWPSGTKQYMNVLARGAFRDPETGSYAVKKYVADTRDAEGKHQQISLVSLNPDKERYPDIELQPEDDEDVTVVAKVVQALSPEDYERRPKSKRRMGRRNITGRGGLDEQARRLGRRIASFFDAAAPDSDDDDTNETKSDGWQARLVCMDIAAGGLQLEIGPLTGLPPFVKKLRVVGNDWDAVLLAANARMRPTRVTVPPGTGPWRWEALGFEDEADLGVERLALDALDTSSTVVFRIDGDGIGQRVQTTTLALGQSYRLLLPRQIGDSSLGVELDSDGWRVLSIDLAEPLTPATRQTLRLLGLDVGEAWPRLDWVMSPASVHRTNSRGDSYPIFDVSTELMVNVSGIEVEEGDSAILFLHGPGGTERLAVSESGLVSLGRLSKGRWACTLLHSRSAVQPATLLFEVAENATEHIAATWNVTATSGLPSLEIAAPPGWPVDLRWKVLHEETVATLHANEDGTIDVESLRARIEARAHRSRIADLIVDAGELGLHRLSHDGRRSVEQVREELIALWQQRGEMVQSLRGAWLRLLPTWFEPVAWQLGYRLQQLAESTTLSAAGDDELGLAAWVLTVDERDGDDIRRSGSRVLILTVDLDKALESASVWIDRACTSANLRDAIVTDGVRWTTHRRGVRLSRRIWHLGDAPTDDMHSMLADLAEGV